MCKERECEREGEMGGGVRCIYVAWPLHTI